MVISLVKLVSTLCACFCLVSAPIGDALAIPTKSSHERVRWGWQLPQKLSDANTSVCFQVDSTWHLVQGTTAGIEGNAWLAEPTDDLSVRATINFPVARFSTGGGMRDERMREVMDEGHSHYVTLAVDSLSPQCSAQEFNRTHECVVEARSRLSIRGNERPMILNGTLRDTHEAIEFFGKVDFSWVDFGVEDPSILVAKLEPVMSVEYSVRLPRAAAKSKTTP
jgi:hypothetical protein